jgi:carboxymethylenebutenolidase
LRLETSTAPPKRPEGKIMKDETTPHHPDAPQVLGSRREILVGGVAFAAAVAAQGAGAVAQTASAAPRGPAPYRTQRTELVEFTGFKGDKGIAYYARPEGAGPFPAAIVIHHAPGWDDWTMEVARKLAHNGIIGIAPNLYFRYAGTPDDQAAKARAAGGDSDDQVMGDVEGALAFVRSRPESNQKVGVMGFCSGGRYTFMAAGRIKSMNAAVDCWGGSVIAAPAQLTPKRPVNPIDYAKDINCPVLGIFGNEDRNPDKAQVNKIEETLEGLGKTHTFHRYDGAGHAFLDSDRPSYRAEQAVDAWRKIYAFYHKTLA